MIDQLSKAVTKSGKYRRTKSDLKAELTGERYCTSGNHFKPTETVKIYKGSSGVGVPRCDECQARRVAVMESRK